MRKEKYLNYDLIYSISSKLKLNSIVDFSRNSGFGSSIDKNIYENYNENGYNYNGLIGGKSLDLNDTNNNNNSMSKYL